MKYRSDALFVHSSIGLILLAALPASSTFAQTSDQPSIMEEVIVTGVPSGGATKLEASVSVSSYGGDDLIDLAPRSTAELFRALPGIRSESSGGGGNANLTVRGIPLATGGSKYMQVHEDGLPVLEYGDINFGNTDNWMRTDWTVSRVESIRGGSASTFASNSPGGIINIISKTGDQEGGTVGVSIGADYDEFRTDFEYGGSLTDTIHYHIGGFFRDGEGVRETGFNGDNGGQIKANLTKEFDDGYLRLYAKSLNDRVTTYLPSPVRVNSGDSYGAVPGYDASSQTLHSQQTNNFTTFDQFGTPVSRSLSDGIESKVNAFGFEFNKSLSDQLSITNKFRISDISGGFIAPFTDGFAGGTDTIAAKGAALCADASVGGVGLDCSGGVTALIDGQLADPNQLAYTNLLFDTEIHDLGLMVNDLQFQWENTNGLAITAGLYYSKQNIKTSWNSWQTRMQTLDGANSRNISYVANGAGIDANGTAIDVTLADNGAVTQSFLAWNWDLEYTTFAPYINVGFDLGDRLRFDVSARHDEVEARGQRLDACCGGNTAVDLNGDGSVGQFTVANGVITRLDSDALLENPGATSAGFISGGVRVLNSNNAAVTDVNYDADNTSFSLGGTFLLTDNSSLFARYSDGGRAVADRLTQVPGSLRPDGSLSSTTDGFDNVQQLELGYKHFGDNWSFFATLFNTITEETQAELTSGLTFVREYESTGLELEGTWDISGNFGIRGNMTWTDAEISDDQTNAAVVGNTPRRQADFIYTLIPEYRAERLTAGLVLQGSTEYYLQDNNDLKQEAYILANLFANWDITADLTAYVNVNNLTDEFIITESEEGSGSVGSFIRARPLNGRSTNIGFMYRF
ncbi:TonB-dependent receptor [Congregibacter variabilis]|uniref:TonB-dependent receptor n=1 Tax=Congregibacter variabilis TaxID=3081200 RepID=A0ABZ0I092_9GAMM|nr:TonB-dependent receptor [Congregibacter sp. IMCC43200]